MNFISEIMVGLLLFFATRIFVHYFFHFNSSRKLPPGPNGFPFVGSLPYLGSMPHVSLARMAKKYGPVMYMKVGIHGMVVASSPESARAVLKTLDMNFSNRPVDGGPKYLAYNAQDMVFASYGPKWRLLRKLTNLHMLGHKALEKWARVRTIEVSHMLHAMNKSSKRGEPVVVPDLLHYAMANIIGQIVISKRVFETEGSESNAFKDMVLELMTIAGQFNIGDFIPILESMDLQGLKQKMKCLHKKFDVLLTRLVEEHKASAHERKNNSDLLDVLQDHEDKSGDERLSVTNTKALLLNLFTAGSDTPSSVIEWALAELLNKPKLLAKAHEEMNRVIGQDRRLEETDLSQLPYLRAICKEAFRKHPSTPLNVPRISTEACEIDGYYVPKNTRLIVNIWAIGRDPNVWENPIEFMPERFLEGKMAKVDPSGNDFQLIPFGAGRRKCAGTRMAIMMVEYLLGSLIHSFDWKLPKEGFELNMDESFGLTLQKAIPLSAMVYPRLSPNAYSVN